MLAASHALSPENWSEQSMDCSTRAQTIACAHTYHADHRHKYRRLASAFVLDAAQKVGDGSQQREKKSLPARNIWRNNENARHDKTLCSFVIGTTNDTMEKNQSSRLT